MCMLSLERAGIRDVLTEVIPVLGGNRSSHGTTWHGAWDGLQGTFLGGEVTYTKELKHGLTKNGCVCCRKGSAIRMSEQD